MSDLIVSYIRTLVPIAVGAVVSWGILPASLSDQAAAAATGAVIGLYYVLVRLLERKWPKLGWLLGTPKAPTY